MAVGLNVRVEVENRYRQYVQVWIDQFGARRIRLDPRLKRIFDQAGLPGFVANRIFVDAKGFIRIRGGSPSDLASPFMQSVLERGRPTELVNASQYLAQAYRDTIRSLVNEQFIEFLDRHSITSASTHNMLNDSRFTQLIVRAPLMAQVIMRSGILNDVTPEKLLTQSDAFVGARALDYLKRDQLAPIVKASVRTLTWLQHSTAIGGEQDLRSDQILLQTMALIERCEVPQILRMKPHDWAFLYRVVAVEPKLGTYLVKNPGVAYRSVQNYLSPERKHQYRKHPNQLEERVLLEVKAFMRSGDFGLNEASQFSTVIEKAKGWNRRQRTALQDIEKAAAPKRPRVIYPHFRISRPIRFGYMGKQFEIFPLLTRDALVRDGEEMEHCIGSLYDRDARQGDSVLFSIKGIGHQELRATLETTSRGSLVQLLHFRNGIPTDEFEKAVTEAIRPLYMADVIPIRPQAPEFDGDTFEGLGRNLI